MTETLCLEDTEFPRSWELVELGDLGRWYGGATPSKSRPEFWDSGDVPWLSPKDMGNEIISATRDRLTKTAFDASNVQLVPSGSVALVVRSGILERTLPVAVVPFATTLNQDMKAIAVSTGVEPSWVAWALRAFESDILRSCRKAGTTVASIETARLFRFKIPIPPTAEQRRIVAALEDNLSRLDAGSRQIKAGSLRAARMRLSVTDRAVRGRFSSQVQSDGEAADYLERIVLQRSRLVSRKRIVPRKPSHPLAMKLPASWVTASMDQLCWDIQYGSSTKASTDGGPGDIPMLRMGNIQDGAIRMDSVKYIPQSHPDASALRLSNGDILFNRTNSAELVGKSAVYREALGPATFASYLIRCRLVAEIEPDWVSLVINSPVGRSYIGDVVTQQVGQANVNGTKLATMPIPLPPRAEQVRILQVVENLHAGATRVASAAAVAATRASHLRRSLLAEAFAGRLVSQDLDDEPASMLLERIRRERETRPKPQRRRRTASASQKETLL